MGDFPKSGHILEKAEDIFDILEYSFVSSLQFVLPAFYKLQNFWCNLSALDTPAGRILFLVSALDTKMWDDINALHVAASYLDPSFKGFSFARDAKEIVYQNKLLVLLKKMPYLM